jgi:hypothetical protein
VVRPVLDRHVAKGSRGIGVLDLLIVRRPRFEPSFVDVDALPAVFLHDPPGVIGAVKDLCEFSLLFLGWGSKKFGPSMFTENAVKVLIFSVDFNDDHAS